MRFFPLFFALLLAGCAASADFAGTRWTLASAEVPGETRPPRADTLFLETDSSAAVASCNRCRGSYRAEEGRLVFETMACTKMYCADRLDLGPILDGAWSAEREGDALTLRREADGGEAVLRFVMP